ncbi:MAG: hypothetical protein NTW96_13395 [Planctomycetia bacterium]|nr:hypothetical protein [Planctomycetia bacterium]
MSENPYQAPPLEPPVVGVLSGTREDLRSVAVYQKGILVCILVYLIVIIGQFFVPAGLMIVLGLAGLGAGLAGLVFVFLLSTKVYGTGVGILLAILTFVPLLGLVVLLSINGKATATLQLNGHRVGLLGADLSEF